MSFQLGSYLFILLDIAPRIAPTNWSGPILAMSGARRSQEHATEANVKRLPPFFLCLFLSFSLSLSLFLLIGAIQVVESSISERLTGQLVSIVSTATKLLQNLSSSGRVF